MGSFNNLSPMKQKEGEEGVMTLNLKMYSHSIELRNWWNDYDFIIESVKRKTLEIIFVQDVLIGPPLGSRKLWIEQKTFNMGKT